jgi:hypothetical protein
VGEPDRPVESADELEDVDSLPPQVRRVDVALDPLAGVLAQFGVVSFGPPPRQPALLVTAPIPSSAADRIAAFRSSWDSARAEASGSRKFP